MKNDYLCYEIAERVANELKKRNLLPTPTMKKIGLGENTLRNFKTSMPKADTLARIADFLDVSVDYLLGRERVAVAASAPVLSSGSSKMLSLFSQLSEEKQNFLIKQAEMYLESETSTGAGLATLV